MGTLQRQNTLFVSEDWIRIYEAIQNVDFRAYDFDNFTAAIFDHLRDVFPEEFNDWIASSEFVMKVETLAWLSQNISFRIDLNTRENFLSTAERRDSLIRLAELVAYKVNRVKGASGFIRVDRIRTNQPLFDSNNTPLQNKDIIWNDPANEDWFEQFVLVMNSAFTVRSQFGRPLARFQDAAGRTDLYRFNSSGPPGGVYSFSTAVNGVQLPFEVTNSVLDESNGITEELPPNPVNASHIFFKQDGRGLSSINTGFFFDIKQGTLSFTDRDYNTPEVVRTETIDVQNINRDDFYVQQIDEQGDVIADWQQVDTVFGEGVSFFTETGEDAQNVYELDTLENDRVRVRFGDGKFGAIPVGTFRFWYRTSNPQPQIVRPSDLTTKTVTIPYVVDEKVFLLNSNLSLKSSLLNAATSDTNFDIRTRANQVYYAQNRMITGQDYNQFFLKDNSIRKVKSVNRTYAGHSRFAKLHDPTGLYQNVKAVAQDGRLYKKDTLGIQFQSADTDVLGIDELIDQYIKPLFLKSDKSLLYFNEYPEKFFTSLLRWSETSIVSGMSRGNITNNGAIQTVGSTASGDLVFVDADALLRIEAVDGPTVRVERIIDDGTNPDGIILESIIDDNSVIVSVFPAFRDTLNQQEVVDIQDQLNLKRDFGISWNQDTQSYQIITFDNLDTSDDFSLLFQGDTSGLNLDASWMVFLEFIPGGVDEDQWRIVDRGFGLFFESARENDFFFANNEPVLDPETGEVFNDEIVLLECNESRDSLRRRGASNIDGLACTLRAFNFVGDGLETQFQTSESPLDPTSLVTLNDVLQILGVDYTIVTDVSGDILNFTVAPPDGSNIEVTISEQLTATSTQVEQNDGDGTTNEYDLGIQVSRVNNAFTFLDGVLQRPSLDFTFGSIGENVSVVHDQILAVGVSSVVYFLPDVDGLVWKTFNFTGDSLKTDFEISAQGQTDDTVLVAIDGAIQALGDDYTVDQTATSIATISFTSAPGSGTNIRISAAVNPQFVKSNMFVFDTNGSQSQFTLPGVTVLDSEGVIVALDGVMQEGPWSSSPEWTTSLNSVIFSSAPVAGLKLVIFVVAGAAGTLSLTEDIFVDQPGADLGPLSVSSCTVNFLGEDVSFFVEDTLKTPDGYVDSNGLQVVPSDSDRSGFFDNPFVFRDLVIQDGVTDLVLWRKIEEFGFTVNDPISPLTSPKGTYGRSAQGDTAEGSVTDETVVNGDIHLDLTTNTWLIANTTTNFWEAAPDQTEFLSAIGRDNLDFLWKHFSPDAFRIDPSVSNVIDSHILTTTYDDTFRVALFNNTDTDELPQPPTPEDLRVQFADFDNFKSISDSIVYRPARYKILFGRQAEPELQAVFKIIQTTGSVISENDLKTRVLTAIDTFFALDNFDFGETFYLTELLAFIHQELAPDLQTVVAVPVFQDQSFGRLFQIRAEPDELFISSASSEDIEVVQSLSDEELRIGTLLI